MRDLKRIDFVLDVIGSIWKLYPDLRYNQLVKNLQHEYHKRTNDGIKREIYEYNDNAHSMEFLNYHIDLFHVEDDIFYNFLCDYYEELKKQVK